MRKTAHDSNANALGIGRAAEPFGSGRGRMERMGAEPWKARPGAERGKRPEKTELEEK